MPPAGALRVRDARHRRGELGGALGWGRTPGWPSLSLAAEAPDPTPSIAGVWVRAFWMAPGPKNGRRPLREAPSGRPGAGRRHRGTVPSRRHGERDVRRERRCGQDHVVHRRGPRPFLPGGCPGVKARSCFKPPRGVEEPDVAICRPPVKPSAARVRKMPMGIMRCSSLLRDGCSEGPPGPTSSRRVLERQEPTVGTVGLALRVPDAPGCQRRRSRGSSACLV